MSQRQTCQGLIPEQGFCSRTPWPALGASREEKGWEKGGVSSPSWQKQLCLWSVVQGRSVGQGLEGSSSFGALCLGRFPRMAGLSPQPTQGEGGSHLLTGRAETGWGWGMPPAPCPGLRPDPQQAGSTETHLPDTSGRRQRDEGRGWEISDRSHFRPGLAKSFGLCCITGSAQPLQ